MIFDVKSVSQNILNKAKVEADHLTKEGHSPTLAILRIGNDSGSISYERSIINNLKPLNIKVKSIVFDEDIDQDFLLKEIDYLNNSKDVDAILIFKPLPEHIEDEKIIYAIDPTKDVDCLNPTNLGKMLDNVEDGFYPCTAEAVIELLDYYNINVKGKNVVIINNSNVIGKPLSILLTNRFATVTLCHEFTQNLEEFTKNADIVVTATGVYGLITPEMVTPETILIDAGVAIKKSEDGRVETNDRDRPIRSGDVDEACKDKVKAIISLSPGCGGGIGRITTSMLAKNIIKSTKSRKDL